MMSVRSAHGQVSTEPEGALQDVAMSQWEDKAVVTVRATVLAAGTMRVLVNGKPISPAGFALAACAGAHSALAFLSGDLCMAAGEPATALLEVSAWDTRVTSIALNGRPWWQSGDLHMAAPGHLAAALLVAGKLYPLDQDILGGVPVEEACTCFVMAWRGWSALHAPADYVRGYAPE